MKGYYPEQQLLGFNRSDVTILFYNYVNAQLTDEMTVLIVGCGRGLAFDQNSYKSKLQWFKGRCTKVIGIDVDPNAKNNPSVDEFRLIENDEWSIESGSIDMIVCDWVVEHVEHPDKFFKECNRVLKPKGITCIRTSNKLHYVSIGASLIPNRFHSKYVSGIVGLRKDEDVFPTYFKCNTISKLKLLHEKSGFNTVVFAVEPPPWYLKFSRVTFWLGLVYGRLVPSSLKYTIMAFGVKENKSF
ncbi:MAG: class I SAM-dependent methyltransferase [Cyclobacteriaceae bacterium]